MFPTIYKSSWLTLYSYPILLGFSWAVGFHYYERVVSNIIPERVQRLLLFWSTFFISWIGAKAFFLIFSAKDAAGILSRQTNFWIGGGFVFYGGLLTGFLSLLIGTRLLKINQLDFFSKIAPVMALSHGVGRIGCALAGCCFGKEYEFLGGYQLPTHLIEALFLFILWNILKSGERKNLYIYPLSYAGFRFIIEYFRGDLIRGEFVHGLSTSQGLSLVVILITGLVFVNLRKKLS